MKKIPPYFILATLIFLSYGNTLLHSFHFDDVTFILERPWVRGLEKIPQFIFSFTQRPLTILSFNLNYAISQFHVWSYHLFNIFLHVGVTFLVYRFGKTMIEIFLHFHPGEAWLYRRAPLWGAVLFALHPLNTQAVTYISSRSSMLATLFYLIALVSIFKGLLWRIPGQEATGSSTETGFDKRNWKLVGSGIAAWGLGFLCKKIVITLPGPAFLFHYFFISSYSLLGWLRNQAKWVALVLGTLLVMGLLKVALTVPFLVTSPTKFSRADYFLTQTFVIPFEYFRKLLWPVNLNIDIDFPVISELTRLGHFAGMAVLGLIVGVLIVIRDRWVRFGLAWGLITLIPTSSVMPLLDVAVEHRMYLPLVGLCLAVGGGICRLENAIHDGPLFTSIPRPVLLRCAWIGFFLIALGHASMTVDRNRIWKNEITLWADAKKKSPHSIRPLNNLGEAYDKIKLYDKAIVEFEGALKLNPRYTIGLSNIGNIYGKMGQYEKSKRYLRRAIEAEPDYAPAHYNLARALSLTGNREASKEHYAKALKYQPYFEEAWFNLAYIEFETGEFQQSVKHYKNFIEWRPRHPKAWYGLGLTYLGMKQFSDAALAFTKAIKFDPKYLSPRISLAGLYMKQRKNDQALTVYLQLIEDFGGIAGVHRNLGILYSEHKQDPVRAAYHFRESLRLEPLQPQAAEMQKLLLRLESEVIQNNSP